MTAQRHPTASVRTLLVSPNLEHLKKQAKDLLKAVKAGDVSACPVLRLHARFADASDEVILGAGVSLQQVQHALALHFGFKDWSALRYAVESRGITEAQSAIPERDALTAILTAACGRGASDIHIEPGATRTRVRFRIDGALHEQEPLPAALAEAVTRDAMKWAGLDLERPLPQDGHFPVDVGEEVDVRLNALGSLHGPVLTMRCLRSGAIARLADLDLDPEIDRVFRDKLKLSHGLIIVTGPTGSGKTTTLYAALSELDTAQSKVMTVEDPVEYLVDGVDQIPVRADQGIDFPKTIRGVLRQDPDAIMVGEIRNLETANLVIQTVTTGHLALTALHTDDAPGALIRLLDLGVPPFLVRDSVRCVLAQKLVRRVCEQCRREHTPAAADLQAAGLSDNTALYDGSGCEHCLQSGYRGRAGVYSLLEVEEEVKDSVMTGDQARIRAAARTSGCVSMREAAVRKAVAGVTSLEEALRVT